MKDHLGRDIDYLRISLTDRCNLRCVYCMPEEGIESRNHEEILSFEEIIATVKVAARLGIKHLRFTGGEPLVRKGVTELIEACSSIEGIEEVAMTTNGILLPRFADDLKAAGLSRVNISLDTLDPKTYHDLTRRGNLSDALAGVKAAIDVGFDPVKINAVVIRSMDQDLGAFARLTMDHPVHVRFIEYMPIGSSCSYETARWDPDEVIGAREMIKIITASCKAAGTKSPYPIELTKKGSNEEAEKAARSPIEGEAPVGWGPARYWKLPGAQGTIGFITSVSDHFCSSCNRLRLTADGKLRPCLFSDQEIDVREVLRTGSKDELEALFRTALEQKPESHRARTGTLREMVQVGG